VITSELEVIKIHQIKEQLLSSGKLSLDSDWFNTHRSTQLELQVFALDLQNEP
jgi:hypothetical protein